MARNLYPKCCCQCCGEQIGYIGRFVEFIFGDMHKCDIEKNYKVIELKKEIKLLENKKWEELVELEALEYERGGLEYQKEKILEEIYFLKNGYHTEESVGISDFLEL